jgi:polysaccharide pyruvyl transferase WcaK-like protein
MIVVTHAYSRHNAGDGLLVDLTLGRLRRAGIDDSDVVVLAMDPDSFPELASVVKVGTAGRSADLETAKAVATSAGTVLGAVVPRLSLGAAAQAVRQADGFVSVGGGYLRAGNRTNQIGTAINHLPQLIAAARSRRPSIYLPQSVGPLAGPVGGQVRRRLHAMTSVHLRDDRSMAEVGAGPNIHRTADLAVLELAETLAGGMTPRELTGGPIIVARDLTDAPTYRDRLLELGAQLADPRWGVQSEGAATKSDRVFYGKLGVPPAGRVMPLVTGDEPGPVISVRLHGALQSLIAGVPAIHLGYERKSWGAYEDLGLGEWVHSARGFDPALVARQVLELAADPSRFWTAAGTNVPRLQDMSRRLTEELAANLGVR